MKKLLGFIMLASVLLLPIGSWAADTKISAMTTKATPVTADLVPILDSANSNANGKATIGTLSLAAPASGTLPAGSTPSLAGYAAFTDSETADLTSPAILIIGLRKIIFFTAVRAVRFDTSTTLKGNNSSSWTTANGAWMELFSDGTYWRCAIHNAD